MFYFDLLDINFVWESLTSLLEINEWIIGVSSFIAFCLYMLIKEFINGGPDGEDDEGRKKRWKYLLIGLGFAGLFVVLSCAYITGYKNGWFDLPQHLVNNQNQVNYNVNFGDANVLDAVALLDVDIYEVDWDDLEKYTMYQLNQIINALEQGLIPWNEDNYMRAVDLYNFGWSFLDE